MEGFVRLRLDYSTVTWGRDRGSGEDRRIWGKGDMTGIRYRGTLDFNWGGGGWKDLWAHTHRKREVPYGRGPCPA